MMQEKIKDPYIYHTKVQNEHMEIQNDTVALKNV